MKKNVKKPYIPRVPEWTWLDSSGPSGRATAYASTTP
ncbi:hypothetical protein CCACVL1_22556 [Corchorus capsularis]|uniref:Uncharacterized protein n=1 Tax=Corchorus capsularis TaxID=210143 RepID=A0A1R3GY53_COCAP|nr:hypothetical protein CCACVL1_22556 [Corchorus capsularis]